MLIANAGIATVSQDINTPDIELCVASPHTCHSRTSVSVIAAAADLVSFVCATFCPYRVRVRGTIL